MNCRIWNRQLGIGRPKSRRRPPRRFFRSSRKGLGGVASNIGLSFASPILCRPRRFLVPCGYGTYSDCRESPREGFSASVGDSALAGDGPFSNREIMRKGLTPMAPAISMNSATVSSRFPASNFPR